ncbi:MAG TPA: hypothetical protein DHW49_07000 [Anaerolineae bacterium]|nr:hypothetical protein [Anaerolineae bacterium]
MTERFYAPEIKTRFTAEDAEQANVSVKNQMRFMLIVGVMACIFFGFMCYNATSITGFLIYTAVAGLFLYSLWRFNQRVEKNEEIKNTQKQSLPAEELFLSENDIVWEIKKLNPEKTIIAWETIVTYGGGFIEYDVSGRKEKVVTPRVILENNSKVTEYIEKYTKLKKIIKEKYIGNEIETFVYYEKEVNRV